MLGERAAEILPVLMKPEHIVGRDVFAARLHLAV